MSASLSAAKGRVFAFLRDPVYAVGASLLAVFIGLLYYVLLMRGVMTQAIHDRFGIPVAAAPFPWANVWETPESWVGVLNRAGRPGELLFGTAVTAVIVTSVFAGIFIAGILYYRFARVGGAACATGGGVLVMAGAGCPTCLIPATAALGIVIPLVTLPLAGIEFLFVNIAVMGVALLWLRRRVRRT
jgi:hypothetical protein